MQRRSLEVKFSTVGDAGEIEGIASPFGGSPDRDRDTVSPGAFAASLDDHKALGTMPAMLRDHDPHTVIGTWTGLQERADGLHVKGRLALDTPAGAEAWKLVKAGAVRGLSIGFVTKKSTRVAGGVRRLDKLDLAEISLVAVPAAPGARITGLKSAKMENIMSDQNMTNDADGDEFDPAEFADRMTAIEDGYKTLDGRLSAVETTLGKASKGIGRIETILRRPGAAAISNDPAEQAEIEKKAFNGFLRGGVERLDALEIKSLRLGDDSGAGYLAPPEYVKEIVKNIVLYSPVRSIARVMQTGSSAVELPKRIGTPTAAWTGETQTRSESQSTYGKLDFLVREMTAFTEISNTMLEDSQFDIAAEISSDIAEQFGKSEGAAFVSGDGINKPSGFLTDPTVGYLPAGSTTAITADNIIDLYHALPSFYAANAVFAMNRATMGYIRKLKDGNGRYLLEFEGFGPNPSATLLGKQVVEFPDMPDIGNGTTPVVFGDFKSGYRVIDRLQIAIQRDPYTQQTSSIVRFNARRRVAGGVAKGEALKLLKVSNS